MTPSRPYLVRAIYEWLIDNEATPHLVVDVDKPGVSVPDEHIQDGHITLDLTPTAVGNLVMNNEYVAFQAGFGGVLRDLYIPMDAVRGLYAQENGQGMFFDDGEYATAENEAGSDAEDAIPVKEESPAKEPLKPVEKETSKASVSAIPLTKKKKRPTLTIVK